MTNASISSGKMVSFNYFSAMNSWIDFVVSVPETYRLIAQSAISRGIEKYWNMEYECYGNAVECELMTAGVPYVIIYHNSEDESDDYETMWKNLIAGLHPIQV